MALIGIVIVLAAVGGGFAVAGGHFPVLIQPSEFIVILGAAAGTPQAAVRDLQPHAPRRHGGHHGGAWKVAYADFVTAMMALFMVMWLVASTDAKARKEIANYFRTGLMPDGDMSQQGASQIRPSIIEHSPSPPSKAGDTLDRQASQLHHAIQLMAALDPRLADIAANVKVTVTPDGVLIEAIDREGGDSMLFDVSSWKLKPALVSFLEHLAPVLAEGGHPVRVVGHTDSRLFARKDGKNNWDLSYDRADAARKVLQGSPTPPRIECVAAYGDTQLRDAAHRSAQAVTRRPPSTFRRNASAHAPLIVEREVDDLLDGLANVHSITVRQHEQRVRRRLDEHNLIRIDDDRLLVETSQRNHANRALRCDGSAADEKP